MEANKKSDGKRKGSTILDTDEARELKRKEAEDRLRNVDNPGTDMELSPVLAPPADIGSAMPINNSTMKRPRGRPRGGKLTRIGGDFAETTGGKLFTHVLEVLEGQDLYAILTSCFQNSTRGLYISSITGKVSDIILYPPGTQARTIRFEGVFEILSLHGSAEQNEANNQTPAPCNLSISVARDDGQVVGGVVAGPLIAYTPIQVILIGFDEEVLKEKKKNKRSNDSQSNASKSIVPSKATDDNSKVTDDEGAAGSSKTTADKEKCTAPATAVLEVVGSKEADTVLKDQTSSPASPHDGEFQEPLADEEVNYHTPTTPISAHDYTESPSVNSENQTTPICVSPISVYCEDAMQEWQLPADEEVNYDTTNTPISEHDDSTESQSVNTENLTSPIRATPISFYREDLMQEWQPSDVEESASPHGVGPSDEPAAPDSTSTSSE